MPHRCWLNWTRIFSAFRRHPICRGVNRKGRAVYAENLAIHRGSTLRQVSEPNQVIIHRVNICRHCQQSLIPTESQRVHKRQVFEIETGGLFVIEHQAEVKLCPFCRWISKGSFPAEIKAPVQHRTSVFSRIVYLNQCQLLPVGRTAESMNDLFACPISWATVNRATRICSDKLLRVELKIKAQLRDSPVLGVLETVLTPIRQKCFSARYDQILMCVARLIRGSPKGKDVLLSAHNLYRKFLTNNTAILRFMTDVRVSFDNNGANRDLRMLKLQQKISVCFRSTEGVKTSYRVRSYLSSTRKQSRGLLIALKQTLGGKQMAIIR